MRLQPHDTIFRRSSLLRGLALSQAAAPSWTHCFATPDTWSQDDPVFRDDFEGEAGVNDGRVEGPALCA